MALQFNPQNALLDFSALQPLQRGVEGYSKGINEVERKNQWQNALASGVPGVDAAMMPFLRQAGPDQGPKMAFQAMQRGQDVAHRDRAFDASRTDADRNYQINRQQVGFQAASNARAAETHKMAKDRQLAEATLPVITAIMNNPDPASQAQQWGTFLQSHSNWAQRIPQPYQANPTVGARWLYGQAGKMVDGGKPNVMEVEPGKRLVRVGQDGVAREIYAAPTDGGKLDATTMKEIAETDDFTTQTRAALSSLDRALALNEKAYAGTGAQTRADIVNNTIGMFSPSQGAIATGELNNTVVSQALQSLRATFGGNPTEGERKILMDVAGSVSRPATERRIIFETAKRAAAARLQINEAKAKALRNGTYYRPGYEPPNPTQQQPQAPTPTSPSKPAAEMSNDELLKALGVTP